MPRVASPSRRDNGGVPLPTARLLSRTEAASYIGVSGPTFDNLIRNGMMPAAKHIASRRVWDVRALDKAIDALPGGEGEEERIPVL